jgi:dolichol-phosphate mannosyltransferase
MKTITIVTPAYNEADCVDELAARLTAMFDSLRNRYSFDVIVVENGSRDSTYAKLLRIRQRDRRFRVLQMARNFKFEGAVTAGLSLVSADAVVIMSADLQDPPEVIPEFIAEWEKGYDIVYGVVRRRSDESRFRQFATRCFYWLINRLSDTSVPENVSDFRLADRRAYEAFNGLRERNRMLRAMWPWVGFRSIGILHDRPPRHGGRSSYALWGFFIFGLRGILTSSYAPLKVIPVAGVTVAVASFAMLVGFIVRWFWKGVPFDGFGTIVTIMLALFGIMFLFMGVISEYIGMIFEEVRARPSFVISKSHGVGPFDDDALSTIEGVTPQTETPAS